uniref:Putative guanine nucleotide exchange factor for rho and rac gtpase n=1 Tax=Xenopsylla cheopis TaxID=163159 RepID=A0A6M2DSP9_XENCH
MILQRCQFFERLMAGADSEEPTGTATTNHACSMYKLSQDDDVTSQTSSANSVNASDTSYTNDGDCDTGGTSDALTVNSTEPSEDYSTDPSEENSRKDYGFYNIFPGLPDDDIESVPTPSKKLENDSVNKSVEVLRCDLNNEIDRMLSAAGTIEDASLSDSDDKGAIVNKDSEKEALSLEKVQENRRSCILRDLSGTVKELLTTERTYVEDLEFVCRTYMLRACNDDDIPMALQGKSLIIFGNMEKIKDFHKTEFLPALLRCGENPEQICQVFTKFIDKLYCYTEYALNKPHSEKLMKEVMAFFEKTRVAIGDVLGLNSFLLKPLQRLVKYRQLIERIAKNFKKLEIDDKVDYNSFRVKEAATVYSRELTAAIAAETALTELQQQGNDVLMVPFITKCQLPLESFRLLKSSKVIVNKRSVKYQIFLFDNLILFTEPIIMNNEELFSYKDCMYLDRILPPVECQKSINSFTLTSSENKSRIFHIKCSSADERASWITIIRKLLFQQQQAWKEAIKHKMSVTEAPPKTPEEDPSKKIIQMPPILNCPHNLKESGQLRKCGKLTITFKNVMYIGHVTLYEKVVIFSSIVNNHFEELLKFESSIVAENLCISPNMGTSPTKFHVWCNRTNASYILQANSEEAKAAWTKQFDKVVGEQEALRLRNSLAGREVSTPERKGGMRWDTKTRGIKMMRQRWSKKKYGI